MQKAAPIKDATKKQTKKNNNKKYIYLYLVVSLSLQKK